MLIKYKYLSQIFKKKKIREDLVVSDNELI